MVQHRPDLAGPVGHVDQTGDSANQLGRIIGEQEFGDVGELERDDIATTQAQPEQRVGESERGLPDLGVGQLPAGPAIATLSGVRCA